jgi:hypothetical protein
MVIKINSINPNEVMLSILAFSTHELNLKDVNIKIIAINN